MKFGGLCWILMVLLPCWFSSVLPMGGSKVLFGRIFLFILAMIGSIWAVFYVVGMDSMAG